MTMTSNYITVADREIHYVEWGAESGAGRAGTIVMWHGLARTCRDFDDIARHLSGRYRVICPDTPGRGMSQWSPQPEKEYCLDFYVKLATALIDALGLARLHWLGTSMGGAIGSLAAAGPLRERILKLVLNDIGPSLNPVAIQRIRGYAGNPPQFERVSELEAYFRTVYKPFGWLSEAQWRRLTESSTRRLPDGKVAPHYDPKMVHQFVGYPNDYERWPEYDRITAPTLCLRGAESDLLLAETASEMTRRGPRCRLVTIPGVGHAPALNVPEQIGVVEEFLAA